jgi:hypothetical protein
MTSLAFCFLQAARAFTSSGRSLRLPQRNVDLTHELGFVRASFDVKAHADLSLIEEAASRLK